MSRVLRRPAADRDLIEIYRYHARRAGTRAADRFLAQAEATFTLLADMPGLGAAYEPDEPIYADLRHFPVDRSRPYLIFYRPIPGGVEIYRVLHGARDIPGTLSEDGLGMEGDDADGADEAT